MSSPYLKCGWEPTQSIYAKAFESHCYNQPKLHHVGRQVGGRLVRSGKIHPQSVFSFSVRDCVAKGNHIRTVEIIAKVISGPVPAIRQAARSSLRARPDSNADNDERAVSEEIRRE